MIAMSEILSANERSKGDEEEGKGRGRKERGRVNTYQSHAPD